MKPIRHFRERVYITLLALIIPFGNVVLSQSNLFLNFQSNSLDFPSLSERDIRYSNQFFLQVTNPNLQDENNYVLKLDIQGPGIRMTSVGKPGAGLSFKLTSQLNFVSSDLSHFFDLNDLEMTGITQEEYLLRGLPEGIYTVCFTVMDNTFDRNQAASNQACVNLFVRENLPPEIVRPFDEETLVKNDQHLFQWMPRHITSVPVNYHFQVYDYLEGIAPYELLTHFRPLIDEQTFGLQYIYHAESQKLKPGRKYVAFVWVESVYQHITFKNGGFSEPIRFEIEPGTVSTSRTPEGQVPEPNCTYPASDVIINEFNSGMGGGRGVYVELLVTGLQSSQETYDLEGWIIDDNNYFVSNPNANTGHIRLGSCLNGIPRGSLILLYEYNFRHPEIDPAEDGMPNGDGVYQIRFSDACISVTENCPNEVDHHYSCNPQTNNGASWPTHATFNNSGDLIQLRRPDGDLEHAFIWNTNEYSLIASEKVINFNNVNFDIGTGFAFTSGSDWYNVQNYSTFISSQANPGIGNSSSNLTLIDDIEDITTYYPFYITCTHRILGNSSWAVIDISGYTATSSFKVFVDGVPVITYSINNPIQVKLDGVGYHIIKVVDLETNCEDEAIVEVPSACVAGTECDDLNSCTSNDVLNEHCVCAGVPNDEVTFTVTLAHQQNCNYCVSVLPADYDPFIDYFEIESITLLLPSGGTVYLNELDNLDDDRNIIFNFPYCMGCFGNDGLTLMVNDFNAWLVANGISGIVSSGNSGFCSANSLIFTNTNITLISGEAITNVGDPLALDFEEYDCAALPSSSGYYITASLENCGEISAENEEEITGWLWSTGSYEDHILTPNLFDCYSVSVTCSTGCTYTAIYPEDGECDCIVGNPCIPAGNSPEECNTGVIDQNCFCVPNPYPDSDGDDTCDLADICHGFDDGEDSDGDSVPDGCDQCEGFIDSLLTGSENCNVYPCDEITSIEVLELQHLTCDYCLQVDASTTFPSDPSRYFKSISVTIDHQPVEFELISNWQQLNSEGFEVDWGIWNPEGNYAFRYPNVEHANNGKYSAELRGTGTITTNPLAISNVCQIQIDFSYRTKDFENSTESFRLEVSTNNGQTYSTVKEFFYSTDFANETRYNETVFINSPFTNTTKFRFKASTYTSRSVYMDDVVIRHLSSHETGCFSTDNDRSQFISLVDSWLNSINENIDIQLVTGHSDICNSDGDFIQITDSDITFNEIRIIGNGYDGHYQFQSPDCGISQPGETLYVLTAQSTCLESTYEWSTGQTTSSIQVPNVHAGYNVTITCEDGCVYELQHGNQNCIVGSPCENPGDPCNPTGITNEFCDCIPEVPNTTDLNGNGILDCLEPECECDPEIQYTEITGNKYNLCLDLTDVSDHITGATVYFPNNTFVELELEFLEFEYCLGSGVNSQCDPEVVRTFDQFRSDLYKWSLINGDDIKVLYESGNLNACGSGGSLIIENAPFNRLVLHLEEGSDIESSFETTSVVTGYAVTVDLDCPECEHPSYLWSDTSTEPTPLAESVSSPGIGYAVTITCGHCVYEIESEGDILCIVNGDCNDGNTCTTDDHYDDNCNCVGTVSNTNDTDGDGVIDPCDKCPGFNDGVDDDGDTVPNGCDCYPGDNDAEHTGDCTPPCSFGAGADPYYVDLITSSIEMSKLCEFPYIGGFGFCTPEDPDCNDPQWIYFFMHHPNFKLGYCFCPGNCQGDNYFTLEDFADDLEYWLLTVMGDEYADVEVVGTELRISHSFFKFRNLFTELKPLFGDGASPEFSHEYVQTIILGAPCDDNDPCTVYDRWDENCRCVGVFQDTDGDGICDEEDQCEGQIDYIDFNENGIPDCNENQLIDCEGEQIEVCDLFKRLLASGVVTNESELVNPSSPRVIQKNNRLLQEMLYNYFLEVNWDPLNMNFPELIYDLKTGRDTDGDGLVDYLDPCPREGSNYTEEYITVEQMDLDANPECGCDTKSWDNMVVLYGLLFETVSFINEIGSLCYKDDGPQVNIQPGCAEALNIQVYEDEYCVLRAVDGDCAIEFKVNCNGECEAVYLGLYNTPEIGQAPNCTVPGDVSITCDPSQVICPDPTTPCTELAVIVNASGECECVVVATYDIDGDGICNDDDHCPEIDFVDLDADGIDDCIDDCPDTPGMRGEICDDNNPCTYADRIDENCNCVGFDIDLDDDTVFDCEPCDAAKDNDGDGFIDEVTLVNGLPKCDVCPGLDDRLDWDGDGIPDCLDPPYNPLGCPSGFTVVKETGIVLIFDSEDILEEDLPEPVSAWLMGQFTGTGGNSYKFFPYLLISNIRETAGTFEVLYEAEDFSPTIEADEVRMVGITYADHQQCILDDLDEDGIFTQSEETFIELPCPDFITIPEDEQIEFHFNVDPGYTIDPAGLVGAIQVSLSSPGAPIIPTPLNIQPENIRITTTGIKLTFGDINGLAATATYSGSVTLPNTLECTYVSGGSPTADCVIGTETYSIGDPCDDGDPCTHHDKLNASCECVGEDSPDSENNGQGDGLCDAIDPCPDVPNDPLAPDHDGDGYPDCPCPELIIESFELVNGNDLEITLDMMNADQFSHIDVVMTGGPEEWDSTGMAYNNPFIIPNLPYGHDIRITLKGVCLTGGISQVDIEQYVPFGENQFVCGVKIAEFDLKNLSLLPFLNSGDIFHAADFEIKARNVKGQYGKYTGDGYIKVPYLQGARINVSYENITISASRQMVIGKIKVDGFGVAVLGDDISDAINGAINTILDPLIEINGILEELIPLLDALDKLVETTGHLVSEATKNCLITAQNNLVVLQTQQPAPSVAEMQAAIVELKHCQDLYNAELANIIGNLLSLMEVIVDQINLTCGQEQVNEYNVVQNFPELKHDAVLTQISNAFVSGPIEMDIEGEDIVRSLDISFNPSEYSDLADLQNFFNKESELLLCKMVEVMATSEYGLDLTKSKNLVVALLNAGIEFVEEFDEELKANVAPLTIYSENEVFIRNALKAYLYYHLYKNP